MTATKRPEPAADVVTVDLPHDAREGLRRLRERNEAFADAHADMELRRVAAQAMRERDAARALAADALREGLAACEELRGELAPVVALSERRRAALAETLADLATVRAERAEAERELDAATMALRALVDAAAARAPYVRWPELERALAAARAVLGASGA